MRRFRPPALATLAATLLLGVGLDSAEAAWGGPDSWGYTWADSNDSLGPAYNYLYAPTLQSGLGDDGSVVVSLGFSFEFYGIVYSSVRVHSNGAITMGSGGSSLSFWNNCPLSSSSDIVAPFWDDRQT